MEKDIKFSLLLDFYGPLLTPKQSRAIELYYNEDLSLAEVAQDISITRQGAHDLIVRGCEFLTDCESSLGLLEKFNRLEEGLAKISRSAQEIKDCTSDADICALAQGIIDMSLKLSENG